MAVTHEAGKSYQLTAAGDQLNINLYVTRIRWENKGGTLGDDLEITDPDDNNKVILADAFGDESAGAPSVIEYIIEQHWPNGLEVNVLDAGTVRVYYA